MIIYPTTTTHTVEDFDIQLSNGTFMSITVDREAGDTVDWDTSPLVAKFHLSEKPSPTDLDVKMPAEDLTVFVSHIISVTRRTRTVVPVSPEQKDEFRKTLHKLSGTIQ
jgi:hypothetical protein